jgi:hypothetical protein
MKKIILIFLLLIGSTLSAKKFHQYSLNEIKTLTNCIGTFSPLDRKIKKQFRKLNNFPSFKDNFKEVPELNELYLEADYSRNRNFRKFKRLYKKMSKIYNKNNLSSKYNIPDYYSNALFSHYNMSATNPSMFREYELKNNLIEIIIKPIYKSNRQVIVHCVEKLKNNKR